MACSKPFTHRLQLEKLCRICGQKTRGKQFRVQLYHEEILTVYKYNLTNDSLDLHPTNICNRCRCRLGRATKSKESTVVDQFQNRHKLLVFEPHKSNKSCLICQSQRGQPKKYHQLIAYKNVDPVHQLIAALTKQVTALVSRSAIMTNLQQKK